MLYQSLGTELPPVRRLRMKRSIGNPPTIKSRLTARIVLVSKYRANACIAAF
jgi:hypothetical protein